MIKMRKKKIVSGIIVLVIGVLLIIYADNPSPQLRTVFDDTDTIPDNWYWRFKNVVESGVVVHSEYSTSDEVEFFILDSENFELFLKKYKEGEKYTFFRAIYHSFGKSESHTFRAPKDDSYYAILLNDGDNDVSASFKQFEETYSVSAPTALFVIILLPVGFIVLIVGLIQKPKTAENNKNTGHNEASEMHENQRTS